MACQHLPQVWQHLGPAIEGAQSCRQPACYAAASDLWICLQPGCGYISCGRSSRGHAEAHFKQHDDHPVIMHTRRPEIWCHKCDNEVKEADVKVADYNRRVRAFRNLVQPQQSSPAMIAAAPSASPKVGVTSTSLPAGSLWPTDLLGRGDVDASSCSTPHYPPKAGLVGLANMGNTCFLNSVLQALSNVPALAAFFTEVPFAVATDGPTNMAPAFRHYMCQLWDTLPRSGAGALRPNHVLAGLRRVNPLFEGFAQQDAHEALRSLLSELHERLAVEVPVGLYNNDYGYSTVLAKQQQNSQQFSSGAAAMASSPAAERVPGKRKAERVPLGGSGAAADIEETAPGAKRSKRSDGSSSSSKTLSLRNLRELDKASGGKSSKEMDSDDSEEDTAMESAAAAGNREGPDAGASDADDGDEMRRLTGGSLRRQKSTDTEPLSPPAATPSAGGASAGGAGGAASRAAHRAAGVGASWPGREWLNDGPYTGPENVQRSIISDLFQGVFCTRVRCRTCQTDSLTYESFYDLSLPIPRKQHPLGRGGDGSAHPAEAAKWAAQLAGEDGSLATTSQSPSLSATAPDGGASGAAKSDYAVVVPNAMRTALTGAAVDGSSSADAVPQPRSSSGSSRKDSDASDDSSGDGTSGSGTWNLGKVFSSIFCSLKTFANAGHAITGLVGDHIGLADCLYSFCDWEELTGADQYHCETCGCKRDADKRVSIAALPEVLCVHLKRFSYHSWGTKNSTAVAFPITGLDLAPFVWSGGHPQAVRAYVRAKEQQAGRKLAATSASSSTGAISSLSGAATADAHSATRAASGGSAPAGGGGGSGKRTVVSEMSPEARAIFLHRASIGTGVTGVEAVAAAAAVVAHAGADDAAPAIHSGVAAAAHTPIPVSLTMDSAASAAAVRLPLSYAQAYLGPRRVPLRATLGPVPMAASRKASPAYLGDTKYDLVSLVQHLGGMGGGHYIAHAKNRIDNKWYTFDDSFVSQIDADSLTGGKKEGYVLFFTRQRGTGNTVPVPLVPRDPSTPATYFVSRAWMLRYRMLAVPGPISNADILCDHGALKRDLQDRIGQVAVAMTEAQYEALASVYGASEPPLLEVCACPLCEGEARALKQRRSIERARITKVDTVDVSAFPDGTWYLMSAVWLAQWRKFIENEGPTDGTGRGVLPPGPIDNTRLLSKDGKPLKNLKPIIHYRGVNSNVWEFLHSLYGGGPALRRAQIDIYLPDVLANESVPQAST